MSHSNPTNNESHGIRRITLADQAPDCEIRINRPAYALEDICRNKNVVDIGCGFGRFRPIVEGVGGVWTGVEPFEGGGNTVVADAENLPFPDNHFDVAIMHAVMEHIPDVSAAIKECARVLKPGGVLVGYVAFMECFHEISYSHISFKALEHFANKYGMKLEVISGGRRFGLDYHRQVLFYPIPVKWLRPFLAWTTRTWIWLKSRLAWLALRFIRRENAHQASAKADLYFKVECLRLSQGFDFVIRKL
jgi:SAM-dependent methyltransferase